MWYFLYIAVYTVSTVVILQMIDLYIQYKNAIMYSYYHLLTVISFLAQGKSYYLLTLVCHSFIAVVSRYFNSCGDLELRLPPTLACALYSTWRWQCNYSQLRIIYFITICLLLCVSQIKICLLVLFIDQDILRSIKIGFLKD